MHYLFVNKLPRTFFDVLLRSFLEQRFCSVTIAKHALLCSSVLGSYESVTLCQYIKYQDKKYPENGACKLTIVLKNVLIFL